MTTFYAHLKLAKGSGIKARREYMRERRWRETGEEWYEAWRSGLAQEVEQAMIVYCAHYV